MNYREFMRRRGHRLLVWLSSFVLVAAGLTGPALADDPGAGPAQPAVTSEAETGEAPDANAPAAIPTVPGGPTLSRLAGSTRYATAVRISQQRFPTSARTVYLARGDLFLDAMAGGVLTDGPILLVPQCGSVPSVVRAEVSRLAPTSVVALGGPQGLCDQVLTDAAQGRPTDRVAGTDRYGTAAAVAARAFPQGSARAYLAVGSMSPDAMVAGTLSDGPVLLVDPRGTLPGATRATLDSLGVRHVVALGGTSAVPDRVLAEAAVGRTSSRLSGGDRYATAAAIARHAYPQGSRQVYLARGDGENFADAVAAGILTDGPVLLTRGTCTWAPGAVTSYVASVRPTRVVALGGEMALCDSILRDVARAVAPRVAPDCARVSCIALTFDDGPAAPTDEMLELLAARQVPVTLFTVGRKVAADETTVRRAAMDGHQIGNHTYSHPRLTELTRSAQQAEIDRQKAAVQAAGVDDSWHLRPPFGAFDANTRQLGVPVVKWSVNPQDWKGYSAAQIRSTVVAGAFPGAIVIQHDTMPNTVDALPGIIDDLRARGYHFVTVRELLPGLRAGDVAYSRGDVQRAGTAVDPDDGVVDLAPPLMEGLTD